MRHTLVWKEMRGLVPVLGILAAGDLLLVLGFGLLPAGVIADGLLAGLALSAVAVLVTPLCSRDGRRGTLSLLSSLPIPRSRILAARLTAGLMGLLLVTLGGAVVCWLAVRWGWTWRPALPSGRVMTLLAVLCGLGAAAWWLRARFEGWAAWRQRAPGLLAVEWRQKRALLGLLALLPLLHLAGDETLGFASYSVFGWGWLGGALAGASLFTARERDGSRFLLHVLPLARRRLAAARLLGGLAFGGLYLVECLLVFRAEGHAFLAHEPLFAVLMFVLFYGSAFLIGAALSPWLRSTFVTALLALLSTYLVMMIFSFSDSWMESLAEAWAGTGILLAVLLAVAGWSIVRSRAFEPSPHKGTRALLTVLAVWLAVAGLLSLS
jgi:hypothetical protein